jgi:hypothetical protein
MHSRLCRIIWLLPACFLLAACQVAPNSDHGPAFTVSFDSALSETAEDGRLLLLLATHDEKEPRFLVNNSAATQLVFGRNVADWRSNTDVTVDETAVGFPLADLTKVRAGTYYVQALLNRYKEYHLAMAKSSVCRQTGGGRPAMEPQAGQFLFRASANNYQ